MKTIAQTYKENFGAVEFPFKIYDSKGNETYWEYSNGYWVRREYDAKGNITYWENRAGNKWGTPKNSCINKMVEIEGKKYQLREVK